MSESWYLDRGRFWRTVAFAALVFVIAVWCCPLLGRDVLHPGVIFGRGESFDVRVYWDIRLPRSLMASLAGIVLAVAGTAFQALLRNPLATPYTLGVASGASLGAVLAIFFGVSVLPLGLNLSVCAFLGSLLSVMVVLFLSRTVVSGSSTTLVLAGVTLNLVWSALILFLQYLANPMQLLRMVRWSIGGLESSDYLPMLRVLPVVLIAVGIVLWRARELDLCAGGDDFARSRGVNVDRLRLQVLLWASIATGVVVAETGPIGFVGLIVPHACRLIWGADHRLLLPTAALLGAAFLNVCDTAARSVAEGIELPVGVLTAMLGGPFFLLLLLRRRGVLLVGGG